VNNLLQGQGKGAWNETSRFVTNSTVGIGGLFDPASKWGIAKSDAKFGQTFYKWGWRPKQYIVLPLFGPSDEVNSIGFAADRVTNPLNHIKHPYRSASYLTTYNTLAENSEVAAQWLDIESDSYSIIKYAWTYLGRYDQPNPKITGEIDPATLQTLAAVTLAPEDNEFIARNKEIKVKIPSTGKKLKFNYWLQPQSAPLVYVLSGLNAHRLSNLSLTLAEQLYDQGFSVVSTTSVFHPEFMENASTANLPIYAPVDIQDLLVAITQADKKLIKKHPERFTKRALVGMSMGGYMALNLAIKDQQPDLLTFDRYVAINAPVDMVHSAKLIDRFVHSPKGWPESERQSRINNTIHKATASGIISAGPKTPLLFDRIESEYLVGLSFRFGLRDLLFSSQIRNNQGILQSKLSKWRREPAYDEIINYSYEDYFYKFAVPYYREKGISKEEILRHANLRNKKQKLQSQPKIRIITNSNDFMLPSKDLRWLKSTFSNSQLSIFPQGGHLGNLNTQPVKDAIAKALNGLKN